MPNLSGVNPNLAAPQDRPGRRIDPVDDLLRVGTFANISATANGDGAAFKGERVESYLAVLAHSYNGASTGTDNWTVTIQASTAANYANPVTLATLRVPSVSAPAKEYLALEGASVASLMAAAAQGQALYIRAVATKTGTTANLTGQVYLTTGK
jgi:hypothetical protein